jgi:dienelactone hydrolase
MFHVKQLVFCGLALVAHFFSHAANALTLQKVDFESLDEQAGTSAATKLTGYLFRPAADGRKLNPAVVLAHGCSGLVNDKGAIRAGVQFWADHFVAKGWVVLAVDSFNPRGHSEVCTQKDRPILESRERPRDAYGALKYLSAQNYVASDQVLLMGFSNGATGTLYAVEDSGKPIRLAKDAKVSFKAAIALYPGCTSPEKRGLTPAIPLAIMIGALDDWTPAAPCKALIEKAAASGKVAEIKLYADGYHGFDLPGNTVRVRRDVRMRANPGLDGGVHVGGNDAARAAVIKDVDAFLANHLKPAEKGQPAPAAGLEKGAPAIKEVAGIPRQ